MVLFLHLLLEVALGTVFGLLGGLFACRADRCVSHLRPS